MVQREREILTTEAAQNKSVADGKYFQAYQWGDASLCLCVSTQQSNLLWRTYVSHDVKLQTRRLNSSNPSSGYSDKIGNGGPKVTIAPLCSEQGDMAAGYV